MSKTLIVAIIQYSHIRQQQLSISCKCVWYTSIIIIEEYCARSKYQGQGQVITPHSIVGKAIPPLGIN